MEAWRIRNPERVIELFLEKFDDDIFTGYSLSIEYEMFDRLCVYNDNLLIGYITTGLYYPVWEFSNKNDDFIFSREINSLHSYSIIYDLFHFLEKCLLRIDLENLIRVSK
jgi:hypothetical protein